MNRSEFSDQQGNKIWHVTTGLLATSPRLAIPSLALTCKRCWRKLQQTWVVPSSQQSDKTWVALLLLNLVDVPSNWNDLKFRKINILVRMPIAELLHDNELSVVFLCVFIFFALSQRLGVLTQTVMNTVVHRQLLFCHLPEGVCCDVLAPKWVATCNDSRWYVP